MQAQAPNSDITGSGGHSHLPDYRNDPLWLRICAHELDDKNAARPFSKKLAEEQKWMPDFTTKAIAEYKKFVYLCCVAPNGAAPSKVVDEVWHLHLTYTADYWGKFCKETLRKELHHFPSNGGGDEQQKHEKWYGETLKLYDAIFKENPPVGIWPRPGQAKHNNRIEDVVPGFFNTINNKWLLLYLLIPFVAIIVLYQQPNPFDLAGQHFLVFYGIAIIVTCMLTALFLRDNSRRLEAILQAEIAGSSKYELHVLAGDAYTAEQVSLTGALDYKILVPLHYDNMFRIEKGNTKGKKDPLAKELAKYHKDEISKEEVKALIENVTANIKSKYAGLALEYGSWQNHKVLPAIVLLAGIARILQGVMNNQPVVFLVLLIVLFVIVCQTIFVSNKFGTSCRYILGDFLKTGITTATLRNASTIAIIGMWLSNYSGTSSPRNSEGINADASCGSSCGGGSCSSGCGGCSGS